MLSANDDKINKYVLTIISTKHDSLTGKDCFSRFESHILYKNNLFFKLCLSNFHLDQLSYALKFYVLYVNLLTARVELY